MKLESMDHDQPPYVACLSPDSVCSADDIIEFVNEFSFRAVWK